MVLLVEDVRCCFCDGFLEINFLGVCVDVGVRVGEGVECVNLRLVLVKFFVCFEIEFVYIGVYYGYFE